MPSRSAGSASAAGGALAVADGPWPVSASFDAAGLRLGGLRAQELASRFGTPVVIVAEDEVRARARAVAEAFPRALYAAKALTVGAILRTMHEEGLGLLASSGGEAEACLRAGIPAEQIWLHGNNKSDEELALAADAGLGAVIADGPAELPRLDRAARAAGRVVPVLLRAIPEVEVNTHAAIATGHGGSKFGMPAARAVEAATDAGTLPGIAIVGLHAHLGSQLLEPEVFDRELDALLDLAAVIRTATALEPAVLDLGGGFGVRYDDEEPLPPAALAATLRERLARGCAARGLPVPTLAVEPGRSLVANAGCTLYRVGDVKEAPDGTVFVAVDGGMSDNLRPMLYGALHPVALASRASAAPSRRVDVVGKHCESGDVLARGVELPADLRRGDLLAVGVTGAYTYSLANVYNRIGRPAVVGVSGGRAEVWLRREDAADLDRLEVATPRAPADVTLPEGVEIRPARPDDARSYADLRSAVAAEGRWIRDGEVQTARTARRRFRRSWTGKHAHLLALRGSRVVGHLTIQRDDDPATGHVATLAIAVAPDERRRGVGSALMAAAVGWARAVGVDKLMLSVYPDNRAAIALYRRFGFVEEGRLSRHSRGPGGHRDEILMAAWIGETT
jgi:diaminopimelate decarboxylase